MLVKLLGAIDVIAGLILLFGAGIDLPTNLLLFFGIVLIIKSSLGMLKDFASWIDFLSGIVFLLSVIFLIPTWINIILGVLILQKGVVSFS